MTRIRVGTSGWVYKHWAGPFYPKALPTHRWLLHYAEHFDTVEINNTFYRLPEVDTFKAWRNSAPESFVYAVKASRYLTHTKRLKDPREPLRRLLSRARRLRDRLGPVLYQLPPFWRPDVERLGAFLDILPPDIAHVFEFRHPEWYRPEVMDLLESAGAGFCIHDNAAGASPRWVTGNTVYCRFHGPGRYGIDKLSEWANWMVRQAQAGRSVYAYFNNDAEGNAVMDALDLKELLAPVQA